MTLEKNLDAIAETLKLYAEGWKLDEKGPFTQDMLGTYYDMGEQAQAAIPILNQVCRSVERMKNELSQLRQEKRQQVTVIAGIENQVLLEVWMATQRVPLFGQAWAGYLAKGKGVVAVTHRWDKDGESIAFSMESSYWGKEQLQELPEMMRAEILAAIEVYNPEKQAVIAFGGQDLSHRGKRHPFSLDRNYFRLQTVEAGADETVPELAKQLGICQKVFVGSSIETTNE